MKEASSDAQQISDWWDRWPRANIGISTDGLLVIDVDDPSVSWLAEPEEKFRAGCQAISRTPRGGIHYYFKQPTGKHYRCSVGRLAPRVDVRADGGYVIAPPSPGYRWEVPLGPELTVAPQWVLERLEAEQPVIDSHLGEGTRNTNLTRLAGVLRRYGLCEDEMLACLTAVNSHRCRPPLPDREVQAIARSVSRYAPHQISEMVIEDEERDGPYSVAELCAKFPSLRAPVVSGLLREGEIMNVIAPPKTGKSWLVLDLALAVAAGRCWLGFPTVQGSVLILDNELHEETFANRVPLVAVARGISFEEVQHRVYYQSLRGHWQDIFSLRTFFEKRAKPGHFSMIILDAMYRLMPLGADENDNASMCQIYNAIDRYADYTACSFVVVHHTSKGLQVGKSTTDIGAGAGAQSRAADTHLVLRPQTDQDVYSLEAVTRSWPRVPSQICRWVFPVFELDLDKGVSHEGQA